MKLSFNDHIYFIINEASPKLEFFASQYSHMRILDRNWY